jgi:hypothetical protein
MRLIFWAIIAASVAATGPAVAQSVSYESDRPAPLPTDAHKMVCKKEEKIGTRLGAKKVCLTASEWAARAADDREQTEEVQAGTKACSETCQTEQGKPW